MSQVFAGDAVNGTAGVTVPTTSETPVCTGNFVNPPFGNAKAIIFANVNFQTGSGASQVILRIRRNPSGENQPVGGGGTITAAAATNYVLNYQAADAIPDGRPVQYALTVQQTGASGNGTSVTSNIAVVLISG